MRTETRATVIVQALPVLTLVTALGCGLIAGAVFAFSTFVMTGLAALPPAQGIQAMQAINLAAPHGWFLATLLGTAAAAVLLAVLTALTWRHQPGAVLRIVGCVLYLVGVIGVTGACNVPRNNALAALDPSAVDAATQWARFLSGWNAWNHVRTLSGLVATALLILSFKVRSAA